MLLSAQPLIDEQVEVTVRKYTKKHKNRSLVVGIIRNGTVEIQGYGHVSKGQDFVPDENTIFEIGAITSVFTTTLMMLESQAGKFRTIDPINQYLPSDVKAPAFQPFICRMEDPLNLTGGGREGRVKMICEPDPLRQPISISFCDLASHTSGLPNAPKGLYSLHPLSWTRRHRSDPYHDFTRDQLYQNLYKHVLSVPPGAFFSYSNAGIALLGNLIADLHGDDYQSVLRKKILLPLGMHDTGVDIMPEDSYRFADGHRKTGKVTEHWHFDAMAPAGGLRSTAADLARFLNANLDDRESTLQGAFIQVHQPRIDVPRHRNRRETMAGYGWFVSVLNDESNLPVTWISGATGGFRSFMAFNKDVNIAIVILSNSANPVDKMGFEILEHLVSKKNDGFTMAPSFYFNGEL